MRKLFIGIAALLFLASIATSALADEGKEASKINYNKTASSVSIALSDEKMDRVAAGITTLPTGKWIEIWSQGSCIYGCQGRPDSLAGGTVVVNVGNFTPTAISILSAGDPWAVHYSSTQAYSNQ